MKSFVLLAVLIMVVFQNCDGGLGISFISNHRQSLSVHEQGGADTYDGKPTPGTYCRVSENLACAASTKYVQSIIQVDNAKIKLVEDKCTSTNLNFEFNDPGVNYSKLDPDLIGLSRGIFQKCEVNNSGVPVTPTKKTEALCRSQAEPMSVVISKSLATGALEANISFLRNNLVFTANSISVVKTQEPGYSTYASSDRAFDLIVNEMKNSQTTSGQLQTTIDGVKKAVSLDCREANDIPTIIISQDLEIDSSWIDTTRLAGYWKLNESPAVESTAFTDSTLFLTQGRLTTNNDGFNKSDATVVGGAINLDGNDTIVVPNPTDDHLNFYMRSFTYMLWVRADASMSNGDMPFWKGGNSTVNPGYDIECGVGTWSANVSDGVNAKAGIFGNEAAFIGKWVHLAVVVDRSSNELKLYANGELASTINISAIGNIVSLYDLRFGSFPGGSYPFFGSIDDIAIWNAGLAPIEILEIYKRLRPKFY